MHVDWTRAPRLKHALGEGSIMSESGATVVHSDSWKKQCKNYLWFVKHRACFCYIVVVQSLACVSLQHHGLTAVCQASLSSTVSLSLLKLMSIALVMLSNYLILCCPHFLLPSVFPSIKAFSNESALCTSWPLYWNFNAYYQIFKPLQFFPALLLRDN